MSRIWLRTLIALAALLAGACQQQMANQPSYRPLEPSNFFADGRSARPLVPGTIPRGRPEDLSRMPANEVPVGRQAAGAAAMLALQPAALAEALPLIHPESQYVVNFPYALTVDVFKRGRERFTIYCAVCHDPLGTGNGKIVERGYLKPPNYHTDYSRGFERRGVQVLLRDVAIGYFFEVISNGYGAMPDYAEQIPPSDRWAIAGYVRLLQRSQNVRLEDLPERARKAATAALEGKREHGDR